MGIKYSFLWTATNIRLPLNDSPLLAASKNSYRCDLSNDCYCFALQDDIPADLISLLTASDNSFVNHLFSSYSEADSPGAKKKKTVLTKFKVSIALSCNQVQGQVEALTNWAH